MRKCADASQTFTGSSAPDVLGMRLRAQAWTGLQPIDEGPYVDQVWFLRGSTAVFFAASPLEASAAHASVLDLAARANAAAGPVASTTLTPSATVRVDSSPDLTLARGASSP